MTTPLVVVGVGGFGRETLDVVEAVNEASDTLVFEILGVLDSSPSDVNLARLAARGIPFLGSEDAWLEENGKAEYLIGIGSPALRREVDEKFAAAGLSAATVAHPTSTVGSSVTFGAGTVVCAGVQISTNVTIGRHAHLNPNVTIGHDTNLGDFVSINPAATISGDVLVGARTLVGAGAVVLQGLTLGADVLVGASACVVNDIDPGITVKGIPAK